MFALKTNVQVFTITELDCWISETLENRSKSRIEAKSRSTSRDVSSFDSHGNRTLFLFPFCLAEKIIIIC